MARFTNPHDLYKHQKARFAAVQMTAHQMHEKIAYAGLEDGREMLSGGIRTAVLRRLGHPYGRGASAAGRTNTGLMRGAAKTKLKKEGIRGRLTPYPINKQTGRLYRSLGIKRVATSGMQQFDMSAGSSAGRSRWVMNPGGTRFMVDRQFYQGNQPGLISPIVRRWRARNKALIDTLRARNARP